MTSRFLLTMAYNERLLFPVFLGHYERHFDRKEIYVIDHGSDWTQHYDLTETDINVIRIPRDKPFSEESRVRLVKSICSGLLEAYDYAVFVDTDELIALDRYVEVDDPVTYVTGYDVWKQDGRLMGVLESGLCKPSIFRVVPDWNLGFHACSHPRGTQYVPMAHVRYLHGEDSAERLRGRIAVNRTLVADERARGISAHWATGDAHFRAFEARQKDGVDLTEHFPGLCS